MNQRLSDSEAAPAVLQSHADTAGTHCGACDFGAWKLTSCLMQRGKSDALNLRIAGSRRLSPAQQEIRRRTVLVKEVFGTDHAQLTTGDAHWANDTKVWFVLIKDSKDRCPDNPLWGDGWGWALFRSDAPDKQVATDYKKDAVGCHSPAKTDDWIYVKGYSVLHGN